MFWILAALLVIATFLDFQSTFAGFRRNPNAYEANPFMRGLVKRGEFVSQLVVFLINAAIIWAVWLIKSSTDIWWVTLVGLIALHVYAFLHNRRV